MDNSIFRRLNPAERLVAIEMAIEAVASRIDWAEPPRGPTDSELIEYFGPTAVDELEARRTAIKMHMYRLLGIPR